MLEEVVPKRRPGEEQRGGSNRGIRCYWKWICEFDLTKFMRGTALRPGQKRGAVHDEIQMDVFYRGEDNAGGHAMGVDGGQ